MPDEYPAFLGSDHGHPEQQPLQHQVRLLGEDLPVLEGPRLGLVGVADHVFRAGRLRGHQPPLPPGGEAGAAQAPQPGVLEGADHVIGPQLAREHFTQRRVPPWHAGRGRVRVVGPGRAAAVDPGHGVGPVAGPGGGDERVRVVGRGRALVDRDRGRRVAPADAGHLGELDLGVAAVSVPQRGQPLVGALQPAGKVVAGVQRHRRRRGGAEMRVKRDQALYFIQRPVGIPRQRLEFLTRQPAEPLLDGLQRRDQARAGELACARLDTRHPGLGPCHQRPRAWGAASRAGRASSVPAAGSIRTAQNLNSGILPSGSISSVVSRLAAASRKWNGMKQLPRPSR